MTSLGSRGYICSGSLKSATALAQELVGPLVQWATLPDLVQARIRAVDNPKSMAWRRWLTGNTGQYIGYYQDQLMVVIAHGVGPLSTLEGYTKAQRYTKRLIRNPSSISFEGSLLISQQHFDRLVEQQDGVTIHALVADQEWSSGRNQYPTPEQIIQLPIFHACLGTNLEEYLEALCHISAMIDQAQRLPTHPISIDYQVYVQLSSYLNRPSWRQPSGNLLTLSLLNLMHGSDGHNISMHDIHASEGYGNMVVMAGPGTLVDVGDLRIEDDIVSRNPTRLGKFMKVQLD